MYAIAFLFKNTLYLLFSMLMGFVGYKMYKLKKAGFIVFFIVWMLPYYDLFVQKAVKTYYETFRMGNTIYAYPQKDENGKIESLSETKSVSEQPADYLKNQEALNGFREKFSNIDCFVEFYFFDSFKKITDKDGNVTFKIDYNEDIGYARVYFNEDPIRYEKIKDESVYKARYQVLGKQRKGYFYDITNIEFWDMKDHKLLAEGFELSFYTENYNDKFRNKYLSFRAPSGASFSVKDIYLYHHNLANELFFNSKNKG